MTVIYEYCLGPDDICTANCPPVCPSDHTACPGETDDNGCPTPNVCMPINIGSDGDVCPASCTVTCPDNTLWCDGGRNANDCPMPNTCVSKLGN